MQSLHTVFGGMFALKTTMFRHISNQVLPSLYCLQPTFNMRFSVLTAIVAMASTTALGAPSTQHSALEKRFDNSRMTFFFPGLGACGLVNTDADFVS